jgi:NTE family protein
MEPRIGLALGSGSARGLAHIGVLDVLDEEDIPIHCVAGTSIGAVIGGLWASGGLDQYKELLRTLNWWRVMGFFEPALSKSGLFGGNRLMESLKELTGEPRIEQLSRRFVAVATDAETGQEMRLFRGDLVPALRASFAIPGLFTPVLRDGRWLIDGGVAAPVPVEAARALGAEKVIAVNLNTRAALHATAKTGVAPSDDAAPVAVGIDDTVFMGAPIFASGIEIDPMSSVELVLPLEEILEDEATADEPAQSLPDDDDGRGGYAANLLRKEAGDTPPGLAYTLTRSIDWMQVRLTEYQIAEWQPSLVLEPQCGAVKLFDYDKSAAAIEAGRRAMREALPEVRSWLS